MNPSFSIGRMLNRLLPQKNSTITCVCTDDGAGSAICARISTLLYARANGLSYHHTPLLKVSHVPDGQDQIEWTNSWENFFHLGKGEIPAEPHKRKWLKKAHRSILFSHTHYEVFNCHRYVAHFPEMYEAFRDEFREKYFSTEKPVLDLKQGEHNIALHIRRGDVSSQLNQDRFTSMELIVPYLEKIILERPDTRIRIFSEGNKADFTIFDRLERTSLHLNVDPLRTFHHLVMADELYMAKSSFSFLAGLLSRGVCYYEPFYYFYPKIRGWKDVPWLS